jgi:hypothetical protein
MAKKSATKQVVVRTFSAGVHVGALVSRKGQEVTLRSARRIWSWTGALSLHEVASRGITGGKVSVLVSEILLTQAIEVIAMTDAAAAKVASFEVK